MKDCKHNNYFSDELVDAVVEMIKERWKPIPFPEWITCVPSFNHTELVPNFSNRVAQKLGIEFKDVVKKVKNNQQQKLMNNRFYQCNNLDGVFEIKGKIENKPVFFIN